MSTTDEFDRSSAGTLTADVPDDRPADPVLAEDARAAHLRAVVARALRIFADGPRDDDYVPIPDRSRADMDWHIAGIKERTGFVVNDADRRRMYNNQALHDLYGGRYIATLWTDRGVVVLGVGGDEVSAIYAAAPPSALTAFSTDRPGFYVDHL